MFLLRLGHANGDLTHVAAIEMKAVKERDPGHHATLLEEADEFRVTRPSPITALRPELQAAVRVANVTAAGGQGDKPVLSCHARYYTVSHFPFWISHPKGCFSLPDHIYLCIFASSWGRQR